MWKRPPEPRPTCYSKPKAAHCQHHAEKATWTLTYILLKTPNNYIVSIMQKRPPGAWLTSCSECTAAHCQHHAEKATWTLTYLLFKTQTILLSAWCRKCLLIPDLPPVQNPEQPIVSIMQERPPAPKLTNCSKPRAAHCQHHTEKASCTPTYRLFKIQPIISIMQKRPSNPDLHAVQNAEQPIVSMMEKRPSGPWLTICAKSNQFHC